MPIYEYIAKTPWCRACPLCRGGFELLRKLSDPPLATCPDCDAPVTRIVSAHNLGASSTGLDDRAKAAGFHKLKKLGKGEYEKQY